MNIDKLYVINNKDNPAIEFFSLADPVNELVYEISLKDNAYSIYKKTDEGFLVKDENLPLHGLVGLVIDKPVSAENANNIAKSWNIMHKNARNYSQKKFKQFLDEALREFESKSI